MSEPALIPLLPISSARTLELCQSPPEFSHGHTIFICSYPKSGTTWTQNIVVTKTLRILCTMFSHFMVFSKHGTKYQLLSSGNQNFSHISQFSPFYEIDKVTFCGQFKFVQLNVFVTYRLGIYDKELSTRSIQWITKSSEKGHSIHISGGLSSLGIAKTWLRHSNCSFFWLVGWACYLKDQTTSTFICTEMEKMSLLHFIII